MRTLQKSLNLTHFFFFPFSLFLVSLPVQVVMGEAVQAQVVQSRKVDADSLLQQGFQLYQANYYSEAIPVLESALRVYREVIPKHKEEATDDIREKGERGKKNGRGI